MINFYHSCIYFTFPGAVCTFKKGDGIGGSEKRIGDQVGEECVQACLTYKKNVNANVNGVTLRQVQILCSL